MCSQLEGLSALFPKDFDYNVRLVMIIVFINKCAISIWQGAVLVVFVFIMEKDSNEAVGIMAGMSGMAQLASAPLVAYIADAFPRTELFQYGSIIGLVGFIVAVIAIIIEEYYTLCLAMIIVGVYGAMTTPALDAVVADSITQGVRSRVYTWKFTTLILGAACGPLLALVMFVLIGDKWTVDKCQVVMLIGLGLFLFPLFLMRQFREADNFNGKITSRVDTNLTVGSSDAGSTIRSGFDSGAGHGHSTKRVELVQYVAVRAEDADADDTTADNIKLVDGSAVSSSEAVGSVDSKTKTANDTNDIEFGLSDKGKDISDVVSSTCSVAGPTDLLTCCADVPIVPAMIVLSDLLGALASGMSLKFFPIFFEENIHLLPTQLSLLDLFTMLLCAAAANIVQQSSRYLGRMYAALLAKCMGLLFFIILLYCNHYGTTTISTVWMVIGAYMIRTAAMNSTRPLCKSAVMDLIPASQRVRWNAMESFNQAGWAGSAVLGGFLMDAYGVEVNFSVTILLQAISLIPMICVAHLVPNETGATNILEIIKKWRTRT